MTEKEIQYVFLKLIEKKIFVCVIPIDDWNSWTYEIILQDSMSPFFIVHKHNGEFSTYIGALRHGVELSIETIEEINLKPLDVQAIELTT